MYSTYINKVESGERRIDVLELERLLEVYGTSLAKFMDEVHARSAPSAKNGARKKKKN